MSFHISRLLGLLLQICLLLPLVHAYSQPLPCSGFCLALDPSLIRRDDGVYFRYNTNGGIYFQKSTGDGSAGISGPWVDMGAVLPSGSIIDKSVANLWAPDVRKVGSQYIMYYSVSKENTLDSTIGYATSPNLEAGSWTDHGSIGISTHSKAPESPYNAIDQALVVVNGQNYLSFGSYWTNLQIVPLNAAGTGLASTFPADVKQIQYQPTGLHWAEGSFVYSYKPSGSTTAYFYLFWSEGTANNYENVKPAAGNEYHIRVCRSTTVTGGYVDASGRSCLAGYGETVLASHDQVYGPGGQGVIDDPCGPIIYYHYANLTENVSNINFKWGVNYLSWPNGWPIVQGSGSDKPLGFCTSSSISSSGAKGTGAGTPSSSRTSAATPTSSPSKTSVATTSKPPSTSSTAPPAAASSAKTPSTSSAAAAATSTTTSTSTSKAFDVSSLWPSPSSMTAGQCSITTLLVVQTKTEVWQVKDGWWSGVTASSFDCVASTSTVHI